MAWLALTLDRLKTRLSKPELDRIPSAARASGQSAEGVLTSAIAEVTREARGHVAVHNRLGPAGTIPDELDNAILALVRRTIYGRLPGLEEMMDETRKSEIRDATRLLQRVAEGKFRIVPPEELGPQATAASPSIAAPDRRWRLEDQDGL